MPPTGSNNKNKPTTTKKVVPLKARSRRPKVTTHLDLDGVTAFLQQHSANVNAKHTDAAASQDGATRPFTEYTHAQWMCRAECARDAHAFFGAIMTITNKDGSPFYVNNMAAMDFADQTFGSDCIVMMGTNVPRATIMDVIRSLPDAHVMLQTFQPAATYTGERDYDLD